MAYHDLSQAEIVAAAIDRLTEAVRALAPAPAGPCLFKFAERSSYVCDQLAGHGPIHRNTSANLRWFDSGDGLGSRPVPK